jgi:hypothetical protein
MTISKLEKELEEAEKRFIQSEASEALSALNVCHSLYNELAQERMKIYIKTQAFPVKNDDPQTIHLIRYKSNIFITLRSKEQIRKTALIKFPQLMLSEWRDVSDLNIDGNILHIQDLEGFAFPQLELVENSSWIEENKSSFKNRDNFDPELWHSQNHYIVRFNSNMGSGLRGSKVAFEKQSFFSVVVHPPMTLDCIAPSFEVKIYNKSMDDVLAEITKQIFAEENRA